MSYPKCYSRVATEKTLFAMPETGIGLFPDVGGGYFLPRLRTKISHLGMFLALTGHRLKGGDCLHAGVATHLCKSENLSDLKEQLTTAEDENSITNTLERYTKDFPLGKFSLEGKRALIERCFSKSSVEEIVAGLNGSDDGNKIAETIRKMSPTSLKVTFRQLREGQAAASLGEVLMMEFRLANRFCEDKDFYEGVRAVLIDRDNVPKWDPPTLEAVTEEKVAHYFSSLPNDYELRL